VNARNRTQSVGIRAQAAHPRRVDQRRGGRRAARQLLAVAVGQDVAREVNKPARLETEEPRLLLAAPGHYWRALDCGPSPQ